jgi:hypothetical protein
VPAGSEPELVEIAEALGFDPAAALRHIRKTKRSNMDSPTA